MNDIMVKALYREAYNFLARVDDNDLEAKLICPITTRAKSLKDLYRRLLNALTTKKINEAIGNVDCLSEPFLDFNPVKVQARYGENHDQLSGKICSNGNVEIIKPFCDSALWGAALLSNIGSARTFHRFVEKFLNSQMSFAVLPLLLQEEVKGLTFPMACEFLSDSGYPDYVKPNPKIKQLLFDIGAIYDRDNYELLKFMKEVADCNDTSPWTVNQIFRLISAGDPNCKVTSNHCNAFTQHMATILKALPSS